MNNVRLGGPHPASCCCARCVCDKEERREAVSEIAKAAESKRCRRDHVDRVNICTCPGCEMYRDHNYKLRVARLARQKSDRAAFEAAAAHVSFKLEA